MCRHYELNIGITAMNWSYFDLSFIQFPTQRLLNEFRDLDSLGTIENILNSLRQRNTGKMSFLLFINFFTKLY